MAKVKGRGSTCFIGFSATEMQELIALTRKAGLRPTQPNDHFVNYAVKSGDAINDLLSPLPPMADIMTREEFLALLDDPEFIASIPSRANYMKVCFTGFGKAEKTELESIAQKAGMQCIGKMSPVVGFLVTGPNAGPAKIKKAEECDTKIITKDEFLDMVSEVVQSASQ